MTIREYNDKEHNSEDFVNPEFTIEVETAFGKYNIEAYNVGKGFVLEHKYCTPTLCKDTKELPEALETTISKLENNLDTMT